MYMSFLGKISENLTHYVYFNYHFFEVWDLCQWMKTVVFARMDLNYIKSLN